VYNIFCGQNKEIKKALENFWIGSPLPSLCHLNTICQQAEVVESDEIKLRVEKYGKRKRSSAALIIILGRGLDLISR